MRKAIIVLAGILLFSCKNNNEEPETDAVTIEDTLSETVQRVQKESEAPNFDLEEANRLAQLPLDCIGVEYPNKLNQTLGSSADLGGPQELHPAFYGCFDWHSSVHGHWALVSLLKQFPNLEKEEEIRERLKASMSAENIQAELEYFKREHGDTYERTYGWAWLLKLAEELHTWDDPMAEELESNLQPLTDHIEYLFMEFLPKLNYPIRVGEHTNTAFALSLAYDYAKATGQVEFLDLIKERTRDFYLNDDNCPIAWEPSGFDFLSPCLTEIDIMRRVLPKNAFQLWMEDFMPELKSEDFYLEPGVVSDRSDGKLVHLDGLNFSRAWVLYGLANKYPEYSHLNELANEHMNHSFPNLVGDTYEGGHWLGSFALYALQESEGE